MADGPIVLVTNEYEPYVMEYGKRSGLLVEVVTAAFAQVGEDVTIQFRPWRRCAMMVETGEVFAAFPYAKTEKRSEYALFSDSIWTCCNVFFYNKGKMGQFDYTSLEALRDYAIAGTSGNYYEEIFKETGLRVDYAPGEASGVRKIWELRSDLFAEDELVGWTLISKILPNFKQYFGSTPTPWNVNSQHLMVSRKYPRSRELMEAFNAGLRAIRKNGVYDNIVGGYDKGPCPR
jgi:polar amino acid transport system substrate-binding protein